VVLCKKYSKLVLCVCTFKAAQKDLKIHKRIRMAKQAQNKTSKTSGKSTFDKASAARKRAEELRAQKERDKKVKIIFGSVAGGIVLAIAIVAIVIILNQENSVRSPESSYSAAQDKLKALPADKKPSIATSEGGILVGKDYKVLKETPKMPIVDVFSDPICPACGSWDRGTGVSLSKRAAEGGDIAMSFHLLDVFNASSGDAANEADRNYSSRAASSAYYIAQNAPDKFYDYYTALFSEKFQPGEASDYTASPRSDEDLVNLAKSVGVPDDVAEKCVNGQYRDYVQAFTDMRLTSSDENYQIAATPTIYVNDKKVMGSDGKSSNVIDDILKYINEALEK
jgi:protein-disulfide isomerase